MQQQQQTVIMAQPQANPTQAPTGLGYPQGLRSWGTGLFGCFEDIGSCKLNRFYYTLTIDSYNTRLK